jgi:hypothetical protein
MLKAPSESRCHTLSSGSEGGRHGPVARSHRASYRAFAAQAVVGTLWELKIKFN